MSVCIHIIPTHPSFTIHNTYIWFWRPLECDDAAHVLYPPQHTDAGGGDGGGVDGLFRNGAAVVFYGSTRTRGV